MSTTLDPKDAFKSFNARDIYTLIEKFYFLDFSNEEKIQLEYELWHYEFDLPKDVNFTSLFTISELCQKLAWDWEINLLSFGWQITTTCFDSSGVTNNHRTCFFSYENYKNKVTQQDERWFFSLITWLFTLKKRLLKIYHKYNNWLFYIYEKKTSTTSEVKVYVQSFYIFYNINYSYILSWSFSNSLHVG